MVDLVYPVKVNDDLEELRYSLRSVSKNAEGLFNNVWLITKEKLPSWVSRRPMVIDAGDGGTKANDVKSKLLVACNHGSVSNEFVLMCDDFFLVEPIKQWDTWNMGPTSEYVKRLRREGAGAAWLRSVTDTAEWMRQQGHGDIPVYQGHRPLLWNKERLGDAISRYPAAKRLDINGLYPIAGAGPMPGERGMNSKVRDNAMFREKINSRNIPWLSSNNGSFRDGMIGGYIMGMFTESSPYEC